MIETDGENQSSLFSYLNVSITQQQRIVYVPLHHHICIEFKVEVGETFMGL